VDKKVFALLEIIQLLGDSHNSPNPQPQCYQQGIIISRDGKGSCRDNLFIERLWRTIKYKEVYLKAYKNGKDTRIGISDYFRFYNNARPHQALGYRTPEDIFTSVPL
jgi:transposase InsO family protein